MRGWGPRPTPRRCSCSTGTQWRYDIRASALPWCGNDAFGCTGLFYERAVAELVGMTSSSGPGLTLLQVMWRAVTFPSQERLLLYLAHVINHNLIRGGGLHPICFQRMLTLTSVSMHLSDNRGKAVELSRYCKRAAFSSLTLPSQDHLPREAVLIQPRLRLHLPGHSCSP